MAGSVRTGMGIGFGLILALLIFLVGCPVLYFTGCLTTIGFVGVGVGKAHEDAPRTTTRSTTPKGAHGKAKGARGAARRALGTPARGRGEAKRPYGGAKDAGLGEDRVAGGMRLEIGDRKQGLRCCQRRLRSPFGFRCSQIPASANDIQTLPEQPCLSLPTGNMFLIISLT